MDKLKEYHELILEALFNNVVLKNAKAGKIFTPGNEIDVAVKKENEALYNQFLEILKERLRELEAENLKLGASK